MYNLTRGMVLLVLLALRAAGAANYYFSDLAFAGGFQTTLTLINYSPQTVTCTTNFYSDSGAPLSVPFSQGTVSTRTDVLPPENSIHDQTTASLTAPVSEGWAQSSCTGPIEAGLLYRYYVNGVAASEAGVNAETAPTTSFATFAQTATGVAYANPSTTQSATVTFSVISSAGVKLGTTSITLGPLAHGSANLGPLLGLQSFTGMVEITSTIPIISLSLNAEAFPVISSLPSGDLPQGFGGGACTNAIFNGTYYYVLSGDLASGNAIYPYAELGKLVADGQGNVSGRSQASVGGLLSSYTLSGNYSVQPNCSGTLALTVNSKAGSPITFQVVNGGEGAVISESQQSAVIAGRAYRSDGAGQCQNGSLSGGYGYLLTGVVYVSGSAYYSSQAGSVVSDGNGNLSVVSTVNTNGTTLTGNSTGTYSLGSDCSGTAKFTGPGGTASYSIAVFGNGQGIAYLETDANTTVAGTAQPQFGAQ
jgi:hypothetical protein